MSSGASLSALLPARAQAAAREAGLDLETALLGLWEAGRAAWPGVDLSPPIFVAHLARHCPAEGDPGPWLSAVRASDLYLACGCAQGLPAALAAFDQTILSQVPRFLSRIDPSPTFADEVRQAVRERLLCAGPGAAPRIAEYAGRGPLVTFVRVTVGRTALNLRAGLANRMTENLDAAAVNALSSGQDPELSYIRVRYGAVVEAALRDALKELSEDQRSVLRLRFGMGLTIEEVARSLKLSRATVVRRQAAAEMALLKESHRLLRQRLRISQEELHSLLQFVRSHIQLSLTGLLGESGP